ncbi:MAG: hypothetical protein IJR79_02065 [Clostridia bacterium]|nr:hypothetical protein [Clostridia bacterium]MBQ7751738.1 hypothetical protein [Clostridia bacterium]
MDNNIDPANRYDEFIVNNRKRVNYYLNMVMWIFAAAGPAIYAGVAMSVGFAAHRANPKASIDDLEFLADKDMYAEKERYYKENGIERRK